MKVTDKKLESLANYIKQQGRAHVYFCEKRLGVCDKYFKYHILRRFLYDYELDMEGDFIIYNGNENGEIISPAPSAPSTPTHKCPFCDFEAETKSAVAWHVQKEHQNQKPQEVHA